MNEYNNSCVHIYINFFLQVSVATTEQAASADNLSAKQAAAEAIAEGALPHPPHTSDLSTINNSTHHINTGNN